VTSARENIPRRAQHRLAHRAEPDILLGGERLRIIDPLMVRGAQNIGIAEKNAHLWALPTLSVPAGEFDLVRTLESGQCFRWWRWARDAYWGIVGSSVLVIRQSRNDLRVSVCGGAPPADIATFINRYFDLSRDYRAILRHLRRDEVFARLAPRRAGLHILRQDPFEVIISFIISANNHIPRIRSIIERICRVYGAPIDTPFGRAYSFPSPESLAEARLSDLRVKCGLGYRDVYVKRTARAIADHLALAEWATWPTPVLRRRLLQLDGVGEKVADCILLFGFHRLEAFPIDTWIRRAMKELYFADRSPSLGQIRALAIERFGPYAGVAQQYLFATYRTTDERNGKRSPSE